MTRNVKFIFFFKQKTSYEMCISAWSSDVCSSDLASSGFYQYRERRCPAGGCTRHIHVPRPSGGCAVQIGNPADLSNPQGHAPNHLSPPHTQNAPCGALGVCGGERGIRTPEARFRRLHTFQACSFNHSDTSPLEPEGSFRQRSGAPILAVAGIGDKQRRRDRKSTRLNSSH